MEAHGMAVGLEQIDFCQDQVTPVDIYSSICFICLLLLKTVLILDTKFQ